MSCVFHPYLPYGCPLLPLQMALDGRVPYFKGKLPWGWQAIIMLKLSQYHLWTGRSGMLQSLGLQRVGHNWVSWLTDSLWGASSQQFFFFFFWSFLVKLQADGSRLHISFSVKALLTVCRKQKRGAFKMPTQAVLLKGLPATRCNFLSRIWEVLPT